MKLLMAENIILEGIREKVKEKYSLSDNEMIALSHMDPTPTKKYLNWIAKQYKEATTPRSLEAFSAKYLKLIRDWDDIINRRKSNKDFMIMLTDMFADHEHPIIKAPADINSYPTIDYMKRVNDVAQNFMSKADIKKESVKEKIGNYLIVVPKTKQASCYYGSGTKWCTAGREANMFNNYAKDAIIFYVINLTKEEGEPLQKIAALKYFRDKEVHGIRTGDYTLWNAADKKLDNLEPEDIFPAAVVKWMNDYWTKVVNLDTPLSIEKKTALILPELEEMEGAHMDYTIGKGWEFHIEDDMGGWFATFAKEMPPEGWYIVYATPFYDGVNFVPIDMQDPEGSQVAYDTVTLPEVTTGDEEPAKKTISGIF